jgi:hypothetical protein
MSKELKRTERKLKAKEKSVPAVIFNRKRKHRMTGRKIMMTEKELIAPRSQFGLPMVDDRRKKKKGWKRVVKAPLLKKDVEDTFKLTNGVNVNPALISAIKGVDDVKVAKRVAKIANAWFKKLYGLEEIRMVREFQVGDDVWWRKKNMVHTGRVVRLKSRKLVIDVEPWNPNDERVVLSVRKVTKGTVPKEHIQPDPKRWRVGRVSQEGGGARSAEAVVQ